jgi:hypothetical protein
MSTELVEMAWSNFPEGGSKLTVLMAIAEACNSEGNCGIPLAKLAGLSRVSLSTAHIAVKALRMERWIVTGRLQGQGGILVMQINLPKLNRSTRPAIYDPDPPEGDHVRATRKVQQRRESRMARSSGGIARTESRGGS